MHTTRAPRDKKKLILFDLDGTLTETKSPVDDEMKDLLEKLVEYFFVGVMSGGPLAQLHKQLIDHLNLSGEEKKKLYLFPTCGSTFCRHHDGWTTVYKDSFSEAEKEKIFEAFKYALAAYGYTPPDDPQGDIIEDRESQITFSALGQYAPPEEKKKWDPDSAKRLAIRELLIPRLPEFEVRLGGTTSLDVTRAGVDKAYGVAQIEKYLGFTKPEMLFIGDRLFEGGNDYPVKQAGVECVAVTDHHETKKAIRTLLVSS